MAGPRRYRFLCAALLSLQVTAAPAQTDRPDWALPQYEVGETIPDTPELHQEFPGLDLPTLPPEEGYSRANETIYRCLTATHEVLEVIPIGTVLLF